MSLSRTPSSLLIGCGPEARTTTICLGLALALSACDPNTDAEPPEPPPAPVRTLGGTARPVRSALAAQAQDLPPSGQEAREGLEAKAWQVDPAGNPGQAECVACKQKKEAFHRLALELAGGPRETTALRLEGHWRLAVDAGAATELGVFNDTGAALRLSLAYSFGAGFAWHECPPLEARPGWNFFAIAQDAGDFKSARSAWRPAGTLPKDEECRALTLVVHNGRRTGRVFIEYLEPAWVKQAPAEAKK